jgi:hypothetical protein
MINSLYFLIIVCFLSRSNFTKDDLFHKSSLVKLDVHLFSTTKLLKINVDLNNATEYMQSIYSVALLRCPVHLQQV